MAVVASFPVIDLQRTGRSIEARRKEAGLSVRQLQDYFGFEYPQAIYKWQHGECLPTVDNLLALSRLLRVSMEDLLVYEDQEVHFFWPGIFSTRMLVKLLPPPGKELFWKMRRQEGLFFETMRDEINYMLTLCGYPALDPRSPFDWIILCALHADDILEVDQHLRDLFRKAFENYLLLVEAEEKPA